MVCGAVSRPVLDLLAILGLRTTMFPGLLRYLGAEVVDWVRYVLGHGSPQEPSSRISRRVPLNAALRAPPPSPVVGLLKIRDIQSPLRGFSGRELYCHFPIICQ